MLKLPATIEYDLQPYGRVTLANLRQSPNPRVAGKWDVTGDVIAGTETSRLFQHSLTKPATGQRTIYGVEQYELNRGCIVRVAM
jgi:hypothetical protein